MRRLDFRLPRAKYEVWSEIHPVEPDLTSVCLVPIADCTGDSLPPVLCPPEEEYMGTSREHCNL